MGQEVSCRALDLYLRIIERHAVPVERFIEGVDVTAAQIRDPNQRIAWNDFALLTDRLEAICGGPEALEDAGAHFTEAPALKNFLIMSALFISARQLYWTAAKFAAGRLFTVVETEFDVLGPSCARLSCVIPEPYRLSKGFFYVTAGTFRAAPRALGLPDAIVTPNIKGRRCDFIIDHGASMTIWARIRYAFLSLFSARAVYNELRAQNDELSKQLAELSRAQRTALEASRLKSAFLANMTHEIRTPMNGVMGMTELLAEGPLTEEQRRYADTIRASSSTLLHLLDDVITYARAEADQVELDHKDFAPRKLVEHAVSSAREKGLLQNGVEVAVDVDATTLPMLRGDAGRIQHALTNLVHNAAKFTHRGRIAVRVSAEPARTGDHDVGLRFEVADTGVGISDSSKGNLFKPFVQADGSLSRKYGGVGLGLAISKQLVELMGGKIGVESTLHVGSTFWFTVPVAHAMTVSEPTVPAMLALKRTDPKTRITGEITQPLPAPAPAPPPPPPAPTTGPTILVAEDNLVNQKVLVMLLQRLGYRTDVAMNGREAVEAFKKNSYAAILMDLQMPEMTGFEAALSIRSLEGNNRIPIIAVSANSEDEYKKQALESGMDSHLGKPIQKQQLAAELARFIHLPASQARA